MSLPGAPPASDRATVEFPSAPGFRGVGRLVLGGVAARFELPIDRVDDLLLAVESLLLQDLVGDTVRIEAEATASGLLVRLATLRPGQLDDPSLRRVLSPLVDTVDEHPSADGASVELVVSAAYRGDGA